MRILQDGLSQTWLVFKFFFSSNKYFFKASNNNSNTQHLSDTYNLSGTVLKILHQLVHFILAQTYVLATIIIPFYMWGDWGVEILRTLLNANKNSQTSYSL